MLDRQVKIDLTTFDEVVIITTSHSSHRYGGTGELYSRWSKKRDDHHLYTALK